VPKQTKEMSAIEVKRLKKKGIYAVGGVAGLYLTVSENGARSWILRIVIGSNRREIGLGAYPEISLADARIKARDCRSQVKQGIDPIAEKRAVKAKLAAQQNVMTFDMAFPKYLKMKTQEFSNEKHIKQWTATLTAHASPVIGSMSVSDIDTSHVLKILEPDWTNKTETMNRVRCRIENVLDWCTAHKYRKGENPARWKGNLQQILPAPGKIIKVKHHAALPWKELPAFMPLLQERQGTAARALEFLIMTAARSGEVRGATWAEIDFQEKLWIVPKERMKAKAEHRVPLSDEAIALLNALPRFENSEYVFAAPRGGALSDMSISAVLKRMNVDAVPHGFRSSFRDWASESTSYPHDVCEMALAHTITSSVEAAYRRGDLLEKRRHMMDSWAAYLRTPAVEKADNVIPIRKSAQG
jgi:integrase